MSEDIGDRLKLVRQRRGLSQRALAKRAGVTNGLISLIEQNRVSPSIASLKKVLDGIPLSLAEFFTEDFVDQQKTFYHRSELPNVGKGNIEFRLIGFDRHSRQMSIMKETYAAGADTGADMLVHSGEEGGMVINGRIEITVGAEVKILGPGDAYYFDSSIPHRFRNIGDEDCELISANAPASF